jgi:hypothetical protein
VIHPTFESPAPATSLGEARLRLASAAKRDEIGDALAGFVLSAFGCGLVAIVREGLALGWKVASFAPHASPAGSISFPLDGPSLLATAFRSDGKPARGAPPPDGAARHAQLASALGESAPPGEAVVVPIVIRRRVVNLVYAQSRGGGALRDDAVAALTSLCDDASAAYGRLLQRERGDKGEKGDKGERSDATDAATNVPAPARRRGWKRPVGGG